MLGALKEKPSEKPRFRGEYADYAADAFNYLRFKRFVGRMRLGEAEGQEVLRQARRLLVGRHFQQAGRFAYLIPGLVVREAGLGLLEGTDQYIRPGEIEPFAKIGGKGWSASRAASRSLERRFGRRKTLGWTTKGLEVAADLARGLVEYRVYKKQGHVGDVGGTLVTPVTAGVGIEVPLKVWPLLTRRREEIGSKAQVEASVAGIWGNAVRVIGLDSLVYLFGAKYSKLLLAQRLEAGVSKTQMAKRGKAAVEDSRARMLELLPSRHHERALRLLGLLQFKRSIG